jgi:hypothetical protein
MSTFELYRLAREHAWLDEQIRAERRRPLPDALRMQALKRRKLSVKERLSALQAGRDDFAAA